MAALPTSRVRTVRRASLIEFAGSTLSAYDVSEPAQPRRLGFYQLAKWYERNALFVTDRHLLLVEDGVLTAIERPRPGA